MDERIRVRWLVKGLGLGGAERLLAMHARRADHERFDYRCWYAVPSKDALVPELRDAGVPTELLGSDGSWWADLSRQLREDPPDVLHAHSPLPASVARLVARTVPANRRPALVTTEHNRWAMYRPQTRAINATTFTLDDLHLAVSQDVVDSIPSWRRDGIRVLVHGIDRRRVREAAAPRQATRDALSIDPRAKVVVALANMRREKSLDVLLRASRIVLDTAEDVVFLHAGVGPHESALRQLHSDLELGDQVRLLGFREDAWSLLAAADVFCLSSRHEGLPVAVMEALTFGVPVVATRAGGIPEAVTDGIHGRLVPVGDVEGLAAALLHVIGDDDARDAMGAAAREQSAIFDVARSTAAIEDIYRALSSGRQVPTWE